MPSLIALGEFRFRTGGVAPDSVSRSTDYRWSAEDRIGNNPALAYIGPGRDQIQLSAQLYPGSGVTAGREAVDELRAAAGEGRPLRLVMGSGRALGLWAIQSVQEDSERLNTAGEGRAVGVRLRLQYYGEREG